MPLYVSTAGGAPHHAQLVDPGVYSLARDQDGGDSIFGSVLVTGRGTGPPTVKFGPVLVRKCAIHVLACTIERQGAATDTTRTESSEVFAMVAGLASAVEVDTMRVPLIIVSQLLRPSFLPLAPTKSTLPDGVEPEFVAAEPSSRASGAAAHGDDGQPMQKRARRMHSDRAAADAADGEKAES